MITPSERQDREERRRGRAMIFWGVVLAATSLAVIAFAVYAYVRISEKVYLRIEDAKRSHAMCAPFGTDIPSHHVESCAKARADKDRTFSLWFEEILSGLEADNVVFRYVPRVYVWTLAAAACLVFALLAAWHIFRGCAVESLKRAEDRLFDALAPSSAKSSRAASAVVRERLDAQTNKILSLLMPTTAPRKEHSV